MLRRRPTPPPAITCLAAALVIVATAVAEPARAHELGAAKITIELTRDGRYEIDAAVFPDHLPSELGGASYDPAALRARVIAAARIVFDGIAERPSEAAPDPAHPDPPMTPGGTPQVVVHYEGPIPGGARSLAWRLDLPVGIYLFGTRDASEEAFAWQWVQSDQASVPVTLLHAPPMPTRTQLARRSLALGFARALPFGVGLALLALAWFLPAPRPGALLAQLATFGVAHFIGLAWGMYGALALEPRVAAPLLALAIVYLGVDNLAVERVGAARLVTVFGFGLIYGSACAGALLATGVRHAERSTAFVALAAGAPALQLVVTGIAFLAIGRWTGSKPWFRARVCFPASALIAITALVWAVTRLLPLTDAK